MSKIFSNRFCSRTSRVAEGLIKWAVAAPIIAVAAAVIFTPFIEARQVSPFVNEVPKTNFTCKSLTPGYYADVETNCQVYHMCDPQSRKYSYLCPNQTAFSQRMMVCDHFHQVNCELSKDYFFLNSRLGNRTENLHQSFPNCPHCRTTAKKQFTATTVNTASSASSGSRSTLAALPASPSPNPSVTQLRQTSPKSNVAVPFALTQQVRVEARSALRRNGQTPLPTPSLATEETSHERASPSSFVSASVTNLGSNSGSTGSTSPWPNKQRFFAVQVPSTGFSQSSAIFPTTTSLSPRATSAKAGSGARTGNSTIQRRGAKVRRPFSVVKRKIAKGITTTDPTSSVTDSVETEGSSVKSSDDVFFDSNEIQVPVFEESRKTSKSEDLDEISSVLPGAPNPTDVAIESHGSRSSERVQHNNQNRSSPKEDVVSSSTANSIVGDGGFSKDLKETGRMWSLLFNLMNSIDDIDHSGMKNFKSIDILNIPWWILPKGELLSHEKGRTDFASRQRGGRKLKTSKDEAPFFVPVNVLRSSSTQEVSVSSEKETTKIINPPLVESQLTFSPTAKPTENLNESTLSSKKSIFFKKTKPGAFRFGSKSSTKVPLGELQKFKLSNKDGVRCNQCHPFFVRDFSTCTPCVKIRR